MKNYIVAVFEERHTGKFPYLITRQTATKATVKRMPASVERMRKWAETQEVKESDGKGFTRTLVRIELSNFMESKVMWERKEQA